MEIAIVSKLKYGVYFLPYNPDLVPRAKEMRKNPTPTEKKLWAFLRQFPLKMWRQRLIDHFIENLGLKPRRETTAFLDL